MHHIVNPVKQLQHIFLQILIYGLDRKKKEDRKKRSFDSQQHDHAV